VRRALVERFGERILDEAGRPDRAAIGRIVFRDRHALDWLEGLLHPRVAAAQLAWRDELARRPDPPALAVTEVPLLYETGGEKRFDAVVAITAPRALRAGRSRTSLEGREGRLLPEEEKVKRADYSYVNDGSVEDLDRFVASVVEQLLSRP
jgi:dephospho-CoA kinase